MNMSARLLHWDLNFVIFDAEGGNTLLPRPSKGMVRGPSSNLEI